ncbi:hypothetical protein WDV85_02930 [Pseudokineococcus sp. 5B2Z-1]|uniref:hypothetical protein n=1 Tax=Pseudokineococcus sp. 5B2Z-1 TaxID=3132744 RepID=UPI0030B30C3D
MAYLALLLPVLVLPVMLAMAAFETRCSDRTPLLRRRPADVVAAEPAVAPALPAGDQRS